MRTTFLKSAGFYFGKLFWICKMFFQEYILNWFRNHLANLKQCVEYTKSCEHGTSQYSISDQWLLMVYNNKLWNSQYCFNNILLTTQTHKQFCQRQRYNWIDDTDADNIVLIANCFWWAYESYSKQKVVAMCYEYCEIYTNSSTFENFLLFFCKLIFEL